MADSDINKEILVKMLQRAKECASREYYHNWKDANDLVKSMDRLISERGDGIGVALKLAQTKANLDMAKANHVIANLKAVQVLGHPLKAEETRVKIVSKCKKTLADKGFKCSFKLEAMLSATSGKESRVSWAFGQARIANFNYLFGHSTELLRRGAT